MILVSQYFHKRYEQVFHFYFLHRCVDDSFWYSWYCVILVIFFIRYDIMVPLYFDSSLRHCTKYNFAPCQLYSISNSINRLPEWDTILASIYHHLLILLYVLFSSVEQTNRCFWKCLFYLIIFIFCSYSKSQWDVVLTYIVWTKMV